MSQKPESEEMVNQAWMGLRRMGQPVIVAITAGKVIGEASRMFSREYSGLVVPAIAWPLVGLSVASSVNVAVDDMETCMNNYIYYGLIGLLATFATLAAPGLQYFFEQLNEGMLKGVFTDTLVSRADTDPFNNGLTLGMNVMVGFHTLYTVFQSRIYDYAFLRSG